MNTIDKHPTASTRPAGGRTLTVSRDRDLPLIRLFTALMLIGAALASMPARAGDSPGEAPYTGALKDAWLHGKVEAAFALNPDLGLYPIELQVSDGTVYLDGAVRSDIDRHLACQIALGIAGVTDVENRLEVNAAMQSGGSTDPNPLLRAVNDATATASVKRKLLDNTLTKGLPIDVDTQDEVVILAGIVRSSNEKDLAEILALNTSNVTTVRNQLDVDPH